MSKKLLLFSFSLFFTISNASVNRQELKIELELLKIKQEKEEFKKQCALINQVWDNFTKEIDSLHPTNSLLLKIALLTSKALLYKACMTTIKEVAPNNSIKKREQELYEQLADLQAQKANPEPKTDK